ncbi:hypothetical protein [Azohydromonas caseinilytica]|uniref:Uncharacterized protein n=1 Tax=Azohydromonas caseinilytica TaxID=2728836 RepID=A0A848FHI7_9BURK|nr:hypothetical protein [Azohydromonas caseinilytica]NML18784.1 hypothetical protein [Azohydromonas caseinilytica]
MDVVELFAVAFLGLLTLFVLGLAVHAWRRHWGLEEVRLLATLGGITGLGAAGVAWL